MRTIKMALFLLLIMLSIHIHASSQILLVSAFDQQEDQHVRDKGARGTEAFNMSIKVAAGGAMVVDKRGGGGGGHGAAGHGGREAGGSSGDNTGKGSDRGYTAVIPLFVAGSGAHHVNNHHHGKNGGTTTYIGLPLLASAILITLLVLQPM